MSTLRRLGGCVLAVLGVAGCATGGDRAAMDGGAALTPVADVSCRGGSGALRGEPARGLHAGQIYGFCVEPWESRVAANGRTEYNPCRRPDAFDRAGQSPSNSAVER